MKFTELRLINVNDHVEKKNGLTYLSWAWAVDKLMELDETATWEFLEEKKYGESVMVFCRVNAFGRSRTAFLPVMNFSNKVIENPNSVDVNKSMQRCLAKAIALHGIGLYIYAGEDIPGTEGLTEDQKSELKAGLTLDAPVVSDESLSSRAKNYVKVLANILLLKDPKTELKVHAENVALTYFGVSKSTEMNKLSTEKLNEGCERIKTKIEELK